MAIARITARQIQARCICIEITAEPEEAHLRAAISAFLTTAALLAAPIANAASPGTPQVTVGADIKQLIFEWDDVSGAAYYRLMVKGGTAPYKPLIDNIPASSTQVKLSIAAHLLRWPYTRYAVAACNTSGCMRSADISPQNLMLDSIGYFKASNTEAGDQFGRSLVLSDDGRTLAVVGPSEDSNAAGVNGNQTNNSSPGSGAVYVFRRASDGWRQEAYLKAGVNQPAQSFGTTFSEFSGKAIAINANGSLLAVGASRQNVAGIPEAGVVYIYQKSVSGSWSLAATLNSPRPHSLSNFGGSLDMSLDGRTLIVTEIDPPRGGSLPEIRTRIFIRPGTVWQESASFATFRFTEYCLRTRLSRDGNTLVFICINPIVNTEVLYTVKRFGNTWTLVSDQTPVDMGGKGLALDFDATTMAIQQLEDTVEHRRLVGIFRWTGSSWVREAKIPAPPIPDALGSLDFGKNVELSRTGNMLAIGDPLAAEDGAGVSLTSMPGTQTRGAVYVWRRDDRNPTTWTMRSVVKSPDPSGGDLFGSSLAMCGTGNALAVGAEGEDSKANGVDGDRTDNSTTDSGAAYLY